jgi:hypothetical protein
MFFRSLKVTSPLGIAAYASLLKSQGFSLRSKRRLAAENAPKIIRIVPQNIAYP